MAEETIFSKIIRREIPSQIVYEDEKHLAFLDIAPIEKGHTLVIPKKHYSTIMDMPKEEFCELMTVVQKIAKHFEKTLKCGINIWQNNKEVAGQDVMHVHFHVIPRTEKKKIYYLENKVEYLKNEMENYKNKLKLN